MQEKETALDQPLLDPLDRDTEEHDAFAQSRFSVYIGSDEYFDRLNEHATSDGPPLVILGESGSGKSALLANWADEYRSVHPDEHLIIHFIGATPYSADWAVMLRRIMGEFKRRFDIEQDIPTEPDQLRSAFTNWLHMVSANGRIVLILDALNQIEDRDNALDLTWLPPVIPENIRLILSTLPGRPLDELHKRDWPSLAIEPLTRDGRNKLTVEYLDHYGRSLSAERLERIVASEQTHNPLFLRTVLDELNVYKEDRHLERAIDHYLSSESIPELFERVIKRLEQDYEREWPGLVEDALVCIWASRRGLAEEEITSLLGAEVTPLPKSQWVIFCKSIEYLLVSRSGLLAFFHDYMRQAVQDRYLQDDEKQKAARLLLADYFGGQELNPRKVDELPWQLSEAEEWKRLYDLLANLEFLKQAWEMDQFEVKAYWAKIEDTSDLILKGAYQDVLDAPEKVENDTLSSVLDLLKDTGHPSESIYLVDFLTETFRRTGEERKLADSLITQGLLLHNRGDYDDAMVLYKESESIFRKADDKSGLAASLGHQGFTLYNRGDFDGAMKLYKESEQICRELGDKSGLSTCLSRQGGILFMRGDYDSTMKLMEEVERIYRELGDRSRFGKCRSHQGLILWRRGELANALKLLKENERICRELGDNSGLSASLCNQGIILKDLGDFDGAMKVYKDQERICCELGDKPGLSACYNNQGIILRQRGDLDGAMAVFKEAERICRELGLKADLAANLGNQGVILKDRGDFGSAMELFRENELISRELDRKHGVSISLNNQGGIFKELGKFDDAMNILKEAESIAREVGIPDALSGSIVHQADVLLRKDEPEKALPLAEEAYEIATKHELAEETEKSKAILDKIRAELEKAE